MPNDPEWIFQNMGVSHSWKIRGLGRRLFWEIGNIRGDFMWKAGRVQIVQQTSLNRGTRFLEISWSDYHWMATAAHVFQVDDNDGL